MEPNIEQVVELFLKLGLEQVNEPRIELFLELDIELFLELDIELVDKQFVDLDDDCERPQGYGYWAGSEVVVQLLVDVVIGLVVKWLSSCLLMWLLGW